MQIEVAVLVVIAVLVVGAAPTAWAAGPWPENSSVGSPNAVRWYSHNRYDAASTVPIAAITMNVRNVSSGRPKPGL